MDNELSPLGVLRSHFQKTLCLPDEELWAIDAAAATVLCAKAEQTEEGLFVSLTAPPGSGKSVILEGFLDWPGVTHSVSDLTENAMASGAGNVKKPLVLRLDRRCFIMTDMTTFLSYGDDKRNLIMGQLRSAYDARFVKESGAKDHEQKMDSRFTLLGACTDEIYQALEKDQAMGQRMLLFRLFKHYNRERERVIAKNIMLSHLAEKGAFKNQNAVVVKTQFLRLQKQYLTKDRTPLIATPGELPEQFAWRQEIREIESRTKWDLVRFPVPTNMEEHWVTHFHLAETLALLRSAVTVDDLTSSGPETPRRLEKQFCQLSRFRMLLDLRTALNEDDIQLVRMAAKGTLSDVRYKLGKALYEGACDNRRGFQLSELSHRCLGGTTSIATMLKHMEFYKFVERGKFDPGSSSIFYRMTKPHKEAVDQCKFFQT